MLSGYWIIAANLANFEKDTAISSCCLKISGCRHNFDAPRQAVKCNYSFLRKSLLKNHEKLKDEYSAGISIIVETC